MFHWLIVTYGGMLIILFKTVATYGLSGLPCLQRKYPSRKAGDTVITLTHCLFSAILFISINSGPKILDGKLQKQTIHKFQIVSLSNMKKCYSTPSLQGHEIAFCPPYPCCICYLPISHLVAILIIGLIVMVSQCLCSCVSCFT